MEFVSKEIVFDFSLPYSRTQFPLWEASLTPVQAVSSPTYVALLCVWLWSALFLGEQLCTDGSEMAERRPGCPSLLAWHDVAFAPEKVSWAPGWRAFV